MDLTATLIVLFVLIFAALLGLELNMRRMKKEFQFQIDNAWNRISRLEAELQSTKGDAYVESAKVEIRVEKRISDFEGRLGRREDGSE